MTDLQVNTKLPLRRNRPGTKAKDWCHWPDETSENMDSLYHIQQVQRIFSKKKKKQSTFYSLPFDFVRRSFKYNLLFYFLSIFNNVFVVIHLTLILFFKHLINKMKVFGNMNT